MVRVIFLAVLLLVCPLLLVRIFGLRFWLTYHDETVFLQLLYLFSPEFTHFFRLLRVITFLYFLLGFLFFVFGLVLTSFTLSFFSFSVPVSSVRPVSVISVFVFSPLSLLFLHGLLLVLGWCKRLLGNRSGFLLDKHFWNLYLWEFLYNWLRFVLNHWSLNFCRGVNLNSFNFGGGFLGLLNFNFRLFWLFLQYLICDFLLVAFNRLYFLVSLFLGVVCQTFLKFPVIGKVLQDCRQ